MKATIEKVPLSFLIFNLAFAPACPHLSSLLLFNPVNRNEKDAGSALQLHTNQPRHKTVPGNPKPGPGHSQANPSQPIGRLNRQTRPNYFLSISDDSIVRASFLEIRARKAVLKIIVKSVPNNKKDTLAEIEKTSQGT
jgi:hypothetical protein